MKEAVNAKLPDIAMVLVITAKGMAERAIREKGFGYKYSENRIPAWFLHGKELNGSGLAYLEKHGVKSDGTQGEGKKKRRKKGETADPGRYDTTVTWGEFREAQGLQSMFVDLGYSNKMWADMSPVEIRQEAEGIVRALLGARTRENQDKMNYNRERYGDFIGKALGKGAREILTDVIIDEVEQVLKQFQP